jgi:GT2 family glycosyltransferase
MYGEDVQWCMEFKRRGYRVAFVPSAVVIHFMGKSGGDKHTMMAKNMEILIDKYYGPWKKRCLKFLDRLLS